MAQEIKKAPVIQSDEALLVFSDDDICLNTRGPLEWSDIIKEIDQVSNVTKVHSYDIGGMYAKDMTEKAANFYLESLHLNGKLERGMPFAPFIKRSEAYDELLTIADFERRNDDDYGTAEEQHRLTYKDVA